MKSKSSFPGSFVPAFGHPDLLCIIVESAIVEIAKIKERGLTERGKNL